MLAFSSPTAGPAVALLMPILLLVAALVYAYRRRRAEEASLQRLLTRERGWTQVDAPCGLGARDLAGRTAATPRGDRRHGVRWGVGGPLVLRLAGHDTTCEASFFQWYSEERYTTNHDGRTSTRYREVEQTVGMARLPVRCPAVRIGPESIFGRIGLTRGGHQVESSEFNRRFRVDGDDRMVTVQLLDANLQRELLERFAGRSIDLTGDLVVLGGEPDHRDDSLTGVVGEFPAVRQDLAALVRAVPAQFWRAVGVPGSRGA